jgi:type IV pilus assembly protein PilW
VTLLSRQRRQAGIGLVEIMVALVVSSLLIGGLIQIFSSNKQAYVLQDEMSRLQENGRFAFHFLMKDLRMAGYFGCRTMFRSRIIWTAAVAITIFPMISPVPR